MSISPYIAASDYTGRSRCIIISIHITVILTIGGTIDDSLNCRLERCGHMEIVWITDYTLYPAVFELKYLHRIVRKREWKIGQIRVCELPPLFELMWLYQPPTSDQHIL